MKKSYRYKFDNKIAQIVLIALLAISLFIFALNLGNLLGLNIYPYESIAKVVFPTILSFLVSIFLVLIIFGSNYSLEDRFLKIKLMGFIAAKSISYENISTIKLHKDKNVLILFYLDKEAKEYKMIPLNIYDNERDGFIKDIQEKNNTIYYEEVE